MLIFRFDIPEYKPDVKSYMDFMNWNEANVLLTKPWRLFYVSNDFEFRLTVKTHYPTDGGTIPRIFWPFILPRGKGLIAFITHDALYCLKCVPRDIADEVLRELLIFAGVPKWIAHCIYCAVDICAWFRWKIWSKEEAKRYRNLVHFELITAKGKYAKINTYIPFQGDSTAT